MGEQLQQCEKILELNQQQVFEERELNAAALQKNLEVHNSTKAQSIETMGKNLTDVFDSLKRDANSIEREFLAKVKAGRLQRTQNE